MSLTQRLTYPRTVGLSRQDSGGGFTSSTTQTAPVTREFPIFSTYRAEKLVKNRRFAGALKRGSRWLKFKKKIIFYRFLFYFNIIMVGVTEITSAFK